MESSPVCHWHYLIIKFYHTTSSISMRPLSMWGMSLIAFPDNSVIICSHYRLSGTSMSQVVDRFAFDKIQSQLSKLYYFQIIRNPKASDIIPLPFCAIHYEYLPTIFHQITSIIALAIKALPVPNVVIFSFHNISCISIQIRKDRGRSDKPAFFL